MSLRSNIERAHRTAKQWENDPDLLLEIRASIPFSELVPELVGELEYRWKSFLEEGSPASDTATIGLPDTCKTSYFVKDDLNYDGDDLLFKRLTIYFKKEIMTWVDRPPCSNHTCQGNTDGKQMVHTITRGPISDEEKEGQASRVEVYTCQLCNTETTFPRYNSPRALYKSRRGRCGEFANLFGAYCRAVGYDTRYILDLTDHVWTEVWSVRQQRWLHGDSCEGIIDRPNMYEQGWGKKLNYAIAATHDSVVDVTKRYTRKFYSDEFQARRREFTVDETDSYTIFNNVYHSIKQTRNKNKGRAEELEKREIAESSFFKLVEASGVWDHDYKEGRISGSWAWKASRRELGECISERKGNFKTNEEKKEEDNTVEETHSFFVESFYPTPHHSDHVTIIVQNAFTILPQDSYNANPECIIVNKLPCAMNIHQGISTVVVDELSGCVLQCRASYNWSSTAAFLNTVPSGRIVAIYSNCSTNAIDEASLNYLRRVGGLNVDCNTQSDTPVSEFLFFVGQIGFHPKWATCYKCNGGPGGIKVSIQLSMSPSITLRLRSEAHTAPAIVSARLPESIMPLETQLIASGVQKRVAFEAYTNKFCNSSVVGYVTRSGAPVYLIGNESFPFRRTDGPFNDSNAKVNSWVTHHILPDVLIDDDASAQEDDKSLAVNPKFDIPVADDYFIGLLGTELLAKTSAAPLAQVDTVSALANTRIVGLYFSAHWCGPCRAFTPMLIEFFNHLQQEVAPTHGLEIIFVSSDRSEIEFQQYYQTMPFKAVPFSNRKLAQQLKSIFGVSGIPSLVVIDSLSGQIVVSSAQSRREVQQACSMGEQAIERLFNDWLDRIPSESKLMLDMLALSCEEAQTEVAKSFSKADDYLMRKNQEVEIRDSGPLSPDDYAALVKKIFTELVEKGVDPNAAALEAMNHANTEQHTRSSVLKLEKGTLVGVVHHLSVINRLSTTIASAAENMFSLNLEDRSKAFNVLHTAMKYVRNVQKHPSNPRFRIFRLSNKIFDQITSIPGGIQLLKCLGFSFFHSDNDFVASIPLSADLVSMSSALDKIITLYAD